MSKTSGIIDAHHHIWRQADLPWLLGPMQPRIFGPYESIRRDYLIEEFLSDVTAEGIEKSVYVQANWAPNWFVDEATWVQSIANASGWPHGIVGFADFTTHDVRPDLDRLAALPLMRGLRQQFHWHENAMFRFAPRADQLIEDKVIENIWRLADYEWSFELQVFSGQMKDAAKLAKACPNVTFVLQHAGMLEDLSDVGRAKWKDGMGLLAAQPNVVSKLSGFGTFIHKNDPDHIEGLVKQTVKLFGAERCLFGSNFPIEKIWTSYADLISAYQHASKGFSKKDQAAIFHDTAARVYRL